MVTCSVRECEVTRCNNPDQYTFHRLPTNPALREKWMRTIDRPDWTPSKNSTICSKHFEGKCFIQRKHRRVLMKDSIPTLFIPIKLPRRRPVCSYVNRDITEVVTPSPLTKPRPGPSSLELTPRKKKLINRNTRLKQKKIEKSEPETMDMPPWAIDMQNKWIAAEERRAQVLENMAASMETLATAVNSLATETANTQRSVTQIEWILLNKLQTNEL